MRLYINGSPATPEEVWLIVQRAISQLSERTRLDTR